MEPTTLAAVLQFGSFMIRLAQDVRASQGVDGPLSDAELDVIAAETIRQSQARGLLRADALDRAIAERRQAAE
jgi:hypothetical protein